MAPFLNFIVSKFLYIKSYENVWPSRHINTTDTFICEKNANITLTWELVLSMAKEGTGFSSQRLAEIHKQKWMKSVGFPIKISLSWNMQKSFMLHIIKLFVYFITLQLFPHDMYNYWNNCNVMKWTNSFILLSFERIRDLLYYIYKNYIL